MSIPTEADFLALLNLAAKPAETRPGPKTTWAPTPRNALQLKITLRYIKPPIWRRVVVPDSYTLADLHSVIQTAMGWMGGHLHAFRKARQGFGPQEELPKSASLQRIVQRKGQKILYEYDFGDGWLHEILIEKILPLDQGNAYPVCLGGARACPPEDCGGVPGYFQLLEAFRNPSPENEELREWACGSFDPEAFDAEAVNQCWSGRRKRKRT
jgi:hypothetical protein